jgi:hypothetical protein
MNQRLFPPCGWRKVGPRKWAYTYLGVEVGMTVLDRGGTWRVAVSVKPNLVHLLPTARFANARDAKRFIEAIADGAKGDLLLWPKGERHQ